MLFYRCFKFIFGMFSYQKRFVKLFFQIVPIWSLEWHNFRYLELFYEDAIPDRYTFFSKKIDLFHEVSLIFGIIPSISKSICITSLFLQYINFCTLNLHCLYTDFWNLASFVLNLFTNIVNSNTTPDSCFVIFFFLVINLKDKNVLLFGFGSRIKVSSFFV